MKCFKYHEKSKVSCEKKKCRYWVKHKSCQNCCLLIVDDKKHEKITLQDIGDIFNVTRMRICQIEKSAIQKLKSKLNAK
jgi:hypothetical protein